MWLCGWQRHDFSPRVHVAKIRNRQIATTKASWWCWPLTVSGDRAATSWHFRGQNRNLLCVTTKHDFFISGINFSVTSPTRLRAWVEAKEICQSAGRVSIVYRKSCIPLAADAARLCSTWVQGGGQTFLRRGTAGQTVICDREGTFSAGASCERVQLHKRRGCLCNNRCAAEHRVEFL